MSQLWVSEKRKAKSEKCHSWVTFYQHNLPRPPSRTMWAVRALTTLLFAAAHLQLSCATASDKASSVQVADAQGHSPLIPRSLQDSAGASPNPTPSPSEAIMEPRDDAAMTTTEASPPPPHEADQNLTLIWMAISVSVCYCPHGTVQCLQRMSARSNVALHRRSFFFLKGLGDMLLRLCRGR